MQTMTLYIRDDRTKKENLHIYKQVWFDILREDQVLINVIGRSTNVFWEKKSN